MSKRRSTEGSLKRIRQLKYLIEALDSSRIGNVRSIARISDLIDDLELEKSSSVDWKKVLDEIEYIYEIPKKDKEYTKILRLEKFSLILAFLSFIGIIGMGIAMYAFKNFFIYNFSLVFALLAINTAYIIKFYVGIKMNKIYLAHIDELEKHGNMVKKAINFLLPKLRAELKKARYPLEDFRLNLKLVDYDWISVRKKPSILRSSYEVVFKK